MDANTMLDERVRQLLQVVTARVSVVNISDSSDLTRQIIR